MELKVKISIISLCLILLTGCSTNFFEVNLSELEEIYNKNSRKIVQERLDEKTTLYLDHSTCIIDAVNNSNVWKGIFPNLTQYNDELVLIKGQEFDRIPLGLRSDNKISNTLKRIIDRDIPYADIERALREICNGSSQAILVSDFESFDNQNGDLSIRTQDLVPYLSPWLKKWLKRGFSVYIISEPYSESYLGKIWRKKRFYFIFTDDKLEAPISTNLLNQIQNLIGTSCMVYKMTDSDIKIMNSNNKVCSEDIDFSLKRSKEAFDFLNIESSWDDIREYIMKLDEYEEPIEDETALPFLKNYMIVDGNNYSVKNIGLIATNVTKDFIEGKTELSGKDISDAFKIDDQELSNGKVNIYLTKKIFKEGYLLGEYGGNLIRIDFFIKDVDLNTYDPAMFEWESLYKEGEKAICVSKSISNALLDIEVVPTNGNKNYLYTIFVKTNKY